MNPKNSSTITDPNIKNSAVDNNEVDNKDNDGKPEENKKIKQRQGIDVDHDRLQDDDGGHLIASQFLGSGKLENLVPMNSQINRAGGKWYKVWIYGEVLADSSEVYFYFYSITRNKLIYSHDIPNEYKVSDSIYEDLLFELLDIIQELNLEYKENNESVWTNLTFSLDNTGEFIIKYNYDDVLNSEFTDCERQIIWEYEILGVEPESEENKQIINRYLGSKNNA